MTSYYEPSPLTFPDSIRLVELHAGAPSANVTCTVILTRLGDAPPYEAISYTWGATDDQLPLACGPAGAQIIIMVTRNCESMLRRLRSSDAPRLVWVDAICIYSHRTATTHLGTVRFAPQFFEGFNFTHLVNQIWQYILPWCAFFK
jgi:hypothetical protein